MQIARTLPDLAHGNRIVMRRVKVYFQQVPGKSGPDANRAIAGVPFAVHVGGQVASRGETAYDGAIEVLAPAGQPVEVSIFGTTYAVGRSSELEPATNLDGRQRRLLMLGYELGEADGLMGLRYERAVLTFQADNALASDGQAGGQTQKTLQSACGE